MNMFTGASGLLSGPLPQMMKGSLEPIYTEQMISGFKIHLVYYRTLYLDLFYNVIYLFILMLLKTNLPHRLMKVFLHDTKKRILQRFIRKGFILDNRTGNQCRFELSVQSRAEKIRQISDQYPSLNISLS